LSCFERPLIWGEHQRKGGGKGKWPSSRYRLVGGKKKSRHSDLFHRALHSGRGEPGGTSADGRDQAASIVPCLEEKKGKKGRGTQYILRGRGKKKGRCEKGNIGKHLFLRGRKGNSFQSAKKGGGLVYLRCVQWKKKDPQHNGVWKKKVETKLKEGSKARKNHRLS